MEGLSRPLPFGGQQAPQRQPGRQSTRIKVPTHKGEQLSKFKGYTFTGSGVPSESHESEAPQGKNINSREAVKRQVCAKTIPQKESHKSGVEQLIAAAGKVDPEIEIEMEMASARIIKLSVADASRALSRCQTSLFKRPSLLKRAGTFVN